MIRSEALFVRVTPATRRILAEAAPTHDAAGASALASDILEKWATERVPFHRKTSVSRAVEYLRAHPEGWADEPTDFFKGRAS